MKTKEIKFTIQLGKDNQPESIEWEATDAGFEGRKPCTAMTVQLWDQEADNSMYVDLWTKQFMVNQMHAHIFNSVMSLADTCQRATRNSQLADVLRSAAKDFIQKSKEQKQ